MSSPLAMANLPSPSCAPVRVPHRPGVACEPPARESRLLRRFYGFVSASVLRLGASGALRPKDSLLVSDLESRFLLVGK